MLNEITISESEYRLQNLISEVEELKSEMNDLKLMLEAVTGHSDGMEADLLEKIRAGERMFRQVRKMEAIGTLASGIAHDFNNILTIIFGNLELAEMRLPAESPIRKNINSALMATDKGKLLVRQILTFCFQTEQENKPFRIGDVVSEAAEMIRSVISSKIDIKLEIGSEPQIVIGDPIQIHQVLMNLCSNAAYVLKEKGGVIDVILKNTCLKPEDKINIPLLKAGNYAILTVRDNGPGIEKSIVDLIFDPFFTTKKQGEGTGMGLAIVHGIVQKHGGAVYVETDLKKGTAFHCYFPTVSEKI